MSTPANLRVIDGGDPIRQQAAAWFARMRADDVSERDRERWQQWLAADARHAAAYERVERVWSSFGAFAPHPEVAVRVRAMTPPPPQAHPTSVPRRRGWHRAGAIAATLLVALCVWLMLPRPTPELAYATVVGERRTIALEDGTKVDLDTDTRLRVNYSGVERRLSLDRGRAFFRVAKEPRPLMVHTSNGIVRAVGTEFEVYLLAEAVEVALFEGRVQLLAGGADGAPAVPLAMLDPGQRARMTAGGAAPTIRAVALDQAPAWMSGRLVFDDVPLPLALAEFNRYSQRRITLADHTVGRLRVSGVFRNDDARAFVDAMSIAYGLRATASPSGDTVLSERH